MQPLSAVTLLEVWEVARRETAPRRALALLDAASSGMSWEELGALSVGERDTRLLKLRQWAFGVEMRGLSNCPECSEAVEVTLRADEMSSAEACSSEFQVNIRGVEIRARVPSARDLLEVENIRDAGTAQRALLERCIGRSAADLPEGAAELIVRRMAECDPRANIELSLECPACSHRWIALFDVVSYFWKEIDAWARRALTEVHALASAYGWSESEILALSPWRREFYLQMVST